MIVTQEIKTTAEEFFEYLLRMQQRAIHTTSRGLVDFETIMQGITYECFTSRKKDTHYSIMMTVKPCIKNELMDVTYRTKDAVVHYCYRLKDRQCQSSRSLIVSCLHRHKPMRPLHSLQL